LQLYPVGGVSLTTSANNPIIISVLTCLDNIITIKIY